MNGVSLEALGRAALRRSKSGAGRIAPGFSDLTRVTPRSTLIANLLGGLRDLTYVNVAGESAGD